MSLYPKVAKLVTFGRGGDCVYYGKGCTGSGYGTPERPHAADPSSHEIPDGTPVLDKRPAIDTAEGYAWVFRGPMVDVDLLDGQVDKCPAPGPILAAGVANNAYGALLAMHLASTEERGSLDSVSIPEYLAGWVKRGAKVGHYEGGKIVWDN